MNWITRINPGKNAKQQPIEKLPANKRKIGVDRDCRHKAHRPCHRVDVRQTLKNGIFEICQHLRHAKARLILRMIA
jgi:hypothetical protein